MLGIISLILKFCLSYLPQLGAHLDVEAHRKLQEYERQKYKIERESKNLETEIDNPSTRIGRLKAQRDLVIGVETGLEIEIAQINDRIKEIQNEKNEKIARLDGLNDVDVLRVDVFADKSANTGG
jgi:septal ring factor EnvC (AmiA/AmiB activator)